MTAHVPIRECWCCCATFAEVDLVRLAAHPDAGVCSDCARYVGRGIGAPVGAFHGLPDPVLGSRGLHENGQLGAIHRRFGRHLP